MDYWATLPQDAACEIIRRMTRVQEILNYMETSQAFRRYAQVCITYLDSSTYLEIPVEWLANFQNLQITGDMIRVVIRPETIGYLQNLPLLRRANIILRSAGDLQPQTPDEASRNVELLRSAGILQWGPIDPRQVIDGLNLTINPLLTKVNFRIITENFYPTPNYTLLITDSRFVLVGETHNWILAEASPELAREHPELADLTYEEIKNTVSDHDFTRGLMLVFPPWAHRVDPLIPYILRRFPHLQYVDLTEMRQPLSRPFKELILNFIHEVDFGLIDPARPPSSENPPIKPLLEELVTTGAASRRDLFNIIALYASYNRLRRSRGQTTKIIPDALLQRYFGQIVTRRREQANRAEAENPVPGYPPIVRDINLAVWDSADLGSITSVQTPNSQNLHEFDVPGEISPTAIRGFSSRSRG